MCRARACKDLQRANQYQSLITHLPLAWLSLTHSTDRSLSVSPDPPRPPQRAHTAQYAYCLPVTSPYRVRHHAYFHSPTVSTRHRHHHGTNGQLVAIISARAPIGLHTRRRVPAAHSGLHQHRRVRPRRRVPLRLEEIHGPTDLVLQQRVWAQTIPSCLAAAAAAAAAGARRVGWWVQTGEACGVRGVGRKADGGHFEVDRVRGELRFLLCSLLCFLVAETRVRRSAAGSLV